jgi:uncharacterized protein with PQ loop repeat
MAAIKKAASLLVGGIQCIIGGISSILAYFVFASQPLREALTIEPREVSLFMFLLTVFGMLSIMSGLLLVWGRDGRY